VIRDDILKFLADKFSLTVEDIDITFNELYLKYQINCCKDLVSEALDDFTIEEYRACRAFFEFLMTGEKK